MNFFGFLQNLFGVGSPTNPVAETIEVFRENSEKSAQRAAQHRTAALAQYASEFHLRSNRTWLDAFADGLNRLVRPVVTIGLLYPIPATIYAPETMATVWTAIGTLPTGYWAVVGIILPFYFGGRMQVKALSAGNWHRAAQLAAALQPEEAEASDFDNAALSD